MIKVKPYGDSLRARLEAGARDRLHTFLLADGRFRGGVLCGTRMVNEMRANHGLGILETLVLGHGYLAAGLHCGLLKGDNRLALTINCSGPIRGMEVEANAFGEVRGYLKRVPIPVDRPVAPTDLSPFYGAGLLTVTRHLTDAKQPFTGTIELAYGTLAKDLANYYLVSEQTPAAFHLSVRFDPEGEVIGAGGLFVQVMPGAGEAAVGDLERMVRALPSLGDAFAEGGSGEGLVRSAFADLAPRILGDLRVEFMCHCGRERIESMLTMLPEDDLADMVRNGPFPIEIRCHNCNTPYRFSEEEMRRIYGRRYPQN